MYTINFQRQIKEFDKFFLMNSSMVGEKALGIFENEEDLAYYALAHHYYKAHNLSTVCSYTDLYDLNGNRLYDKDLDSIIKKHLPEETQKIDARRKLCNNKFVILLMNINKWKIIKHWTEYEQNLIKNLPKDKKDKLQEVETKSKEYIEGILEKKQINKNMKI